ncbi:MAG: CBS domain-containing protein [Xanthobacteraceae bacterium]|nr:CBS domain-containing protein [Xanthobacteraceae bacterium]
MNVSDILRRKRSSRVVTIRMNETVETAARLLRQEDISALVVKDVCRTEGNVAVGMVTERDVVGAIARHGGAGLAVKVAELISVQRLVSCRSSDSLDDVRRLMREHHIRHLPVIDDHGLVGVISMRDVGLAGLDLADGDIPPPAAFAAGAPSRTASRI